MPEVSIILPTYNRSHLIGRSIRSILNQTYQNFEIIIVDDGSTDDTEEVIKGVMDKRVRYIKHRENKGDASARNTGIRVSEGIYVAFQDDDDEWLSEKLEKQIKIIKDASTKVGVVYTGILFIKDKERFYVPVPKIIPKEGNLSQVLLRSNFIGTPATLIKKECFEKEGLFDERLSHLVDWEMWLRIAKHYQFRFIDEALVIAHFTPGSITSKPTAYFQSLEVILEKHQDSFLKKRTAMARHYSQIGKFLSMEGKTKGKSYFVKSLTLSPDIRTFMNMLLLTLFGIGIYKKIMESYYGIKKSWKKMGLS